MYIGIQQSETATESTITSPYYYNIEHLQEEEMLSDIPQATVVPDSLAAVQAQEVVQVVQRLADPNLKGLVVRQESKFSE